MTEANVTLFAAIAFSAIGLAAFFHYYLAVGRWPRAVGRVIGNQAEKRTAQGFDQYAYFPRIEFTAADGTVHVIKGDIGKTREWPMGAQVPLRYRPANPDHASIAKGWQRLLFAATFIAFAIGCWVAVLR
ncbi:MAG: DUF3592 domain-containing protein [Alphaproteobacteria bacterium]|nr:DUF3592 domain-containing protein [Alphaproteobacteria bacterium]